MAPNIISLCEFWLKLSLYVENFMKKALLNILHNVTNKSTYIGLPSDPRRLYNELRNHHATLNKLKSKKIINKDQWSLLFPDNQQTDSAKFDTTLIILLVINCTTLPSPNGGWRQKCLSIPDKSVGAFVLRAREFRNKIVHYSNPSTLKGSEFTAIWLEGDRILKGLEYVIDTETLKHKSLDPERMDYFRLLLNHLQYGQNQLQQLVDEHTTDISNLSDLAREVIEMKENISSIKEDIEKSSENPEVYQAIEDVYKRLHLLCNNYYKEIEEMNSRIATLEEKYEDHEKRLAELEIGEADEKYFWNVHQNVSNFTGRESVLDELYRKLNTPTNYSYSAVALTGLGGIGKTETAARYAHIYGKKYYDNVFWIHADSMESSLLKLSHILNIDPGNRSIEVLLPVICKSLINTNCLFVLDNVECMDSIQPVLKNLNLNKKPHMIITSQFSQWSGLGIQQIDIDVFTLEEAVNFFQFVDESENEVVEDLITELQHLPLAMQQAVSYIKRNSVSTKTYLDAFRKNRTQLLNVNLTKCGEAIYDKTLLTVWQTALEKLKLYKHEMAIDVINMMSHMDGTFINTKTFLFDENIEDEIDLNEIVEMLCEYSLISKKKSDVTQATVVTMHKLVQKVLNLYSEKEQSNRNSAVVRKHLCNILEKASENSFSWDNDEENIWFIHVKHLWNQGVFLDLLIVHDVAKNRGEYKFLKELFSVILSPENTRDIKDVFSLLFLNQFKCNFFFDYGNEEAAIDLLEQGLINLKRELKNKNFSVLLWKLNYAEIHLKCGDKKKGKNMFRSIEEDMASYKLEQDGFKYVDILMGRMKILDLLGEFKAALDIIKKLERIARESTDARKAFLLDILTVKADISCKLKNSIRASSIEVEIETLIKEMNIKQSNVMYINYTLLKARIFWCQKNYEESLNVLVKSNKIATEYNLHYQRVCILMNIGRIYIVKGDYKNALKEINIAIDVAGESKSDFSHIPIFLKGLILLLLNRLNEAFEELVKINNDAPVSCHERIFDCALKYDILLRSTKVRKWKYGVDSIEFKSMLTSSQVKKREMNRLINEINEKFPFCLLT